MLITDERFGRLLPGASSLVWSLVFDLRLSYIFIFAMAVDIYTLIIIDVNIIQVHLIHCTVLCLFFVSHSLVLNLERGGVL